MNIKNFNIKDYFKIDDDHSKIRGFMVLEDTEGNIIRAKENMIVLAGRDFIFNKLTGGMPSYAINQIQFGTGTSITTPNMTSLESDAAIEIDINSDGTEKFTSANVAELTANKAVIIAEENIDSTSGDPIKLDLCISCFIKKSSDKNENISELGLFRSDKSGEVMFSRVVFEPVPFNNSTDYILNYYIYF